eukprot:6194824-Pleurochrysis_carterae.AAC.1
MLNLAIRSCCVDLELHSSSKSCMLIKFEEHKISVRISLEYISLANCIAVTRTRPLVAPVQQINQEITNKQGRATTSFIKSAYQDGLRTLGNEMSCLSHNVTNN